MNIVKKLPLHLLAALLLIVYAVLQFEFVPVYFNNFANCRKYALSLFDGRTQFSIVCFVANIGALVCWFAAALGLILKKWKLVKVSLLVVVGLMVYNALGGSLTLMMTSYLPDPTWINYVAYAREILFWLGIYLIAATRKPGFAALSAGALVLFYLIQGAVGSLLSVSVLLRVLMVLVLALTMLQPREEKHPLQ